MKLLKILSFICMYLFCFGSIYGFMALLLNTHTFSISIYGFIIIFSIIIFDAMLSVIIDDNEKWWK